MVSALTNPRSHVLVVDDDPIVSSSLRLLLESSGHRVTLAAGGSEALAAVATNAPDLVLLDLGMPLMDGYEVCHCLKSDPRTRLIPVVILTGESGLAARLRAWDLGADDFLCKPIHGVEVLTRCRCLLRVKHLVSDLDCAQSVVFALARAMEAKSRFTQGHSERVTHYALKLAARLGMPAAEQEVLRQGAALHDVGKIAIPDDILNKPGRLTAEEYAQVKLHPLAGVRIVEPLRSIRAAIPLIRWHHERLDGKGYPDGLFGAAIPLGARLLAVTDVYDALSSERPYRAAMDPALCIRTLCAEADEGGLDPELVRLFCGSLNRQEATESSGADQASQEANSTGNIGDAVVS